MQQPAVQQPAVQQQATQSAENSPIYLPTLPARAFLDSEFDAGVIIRNGVGAELNLDKHRLGRPAKIVFAEPAANLTAAWAVARAVAARHPEPALIFVPHLASFDGAALVRGVRSALRAAGRLVPGRFVASPAPGSLFWRDAAGLNRVADSVPG